MTRCKNIADLLPEVAGQFENREAVYEPYGKKPDGTFKYRTLTFRQLENLTNAYAVKFRKCGLTKGTKVLMMVRPGLELTAAVFAVFKTGAIPVIIDPGMGLKKMLSCIEQIAPEAFIGISAAHWISLFSPKNFASIKTRFSLGPCPPPLPSLKRLEKISTPEKIKQSDNIEFDIADTEPDDTAAILFTTGSTGPAKGVIYNHRVYLSQVETIREVYGGGPDFVDMSAFPLFALFAIVMGMPTVIPKMDFTRPAEVDPEIIIKTVQANNVSFSFGSPALWRRVASYCLDNNIKLPSLKKVLMAGAPVPADLHKMIKQVIAEDGETLVPYGATEAMPIANFTGTEMLAETAELTREGKGYCVGYPNPGMIIKIIEYSNEIIPVWKDDIELPTGKIGEIVIKGDVVTPEYFNQPDATAMSKTHGLDMRLWHRMGDMGYFDEKGRLFFCGRKSHRIVTSEEIYYPVCSEAIFNQHPAVHRSALVGIERSGKTIPVLFIEPKPDKWPAGKAEKEKLIAELKELGKNYSFTAKINDFMFKRKFPVDIRHNAKIFREQLAVIADKKL